MRVQVQLIAAFDQLIARFSRAPTTVRAAAEVVMNDVGRYLLGRVQQNLSGDVLQTRSGDLLHSMTYEVTSNAAGITARVFSDGSVPYARIQEVGGQTRPHEIVARRSKALRYFGINGMQFSYSVEHPGSKIPAAMYIRRVLISDRTNVNRMIRQGMKGVI